MTNPVPPPLATQSLLTYKPLSTETPEIRLLTLEASLDNEAPISCSLQLSNLDGDNLEFTALSYVWGDPMDRKEITVNGCILMVTRNLFSALQNIRAAFGEKVLWIDAICVNQDDKTERSSQVQLMISIYRKAIEVIAWLGPDDDGGADALRMVEKMSDAIAQYPDHYEWLKHALTLPNEGPFPRHKLEVLEQIARLFDRPFWNRVWLFQELILARTLTFMCGNVQLQFPDNLEEINAQGRTLLSTEPPAWSNPFADSLLDCLINIHWLSWLKIQSYRVWLDEVEGKEAAFNINLLVIMTAERLATDPRDKIYGLMGLSNIPSIIPDYSKSISDVYIEFSGWWAQGGNLEFLLCAQLVPNLSSNRSVGYIPSWVPDWHAISQFLSSEASSPRSPLLAYAQVRADQTFQDLTPSPVVDGQLLRLKGIVLDNIATLHGPSVPLELEFYASLFVETADKLLPAGRPLHIPAVRALFYVLLDGLDLMGHNVRLDPDSVTITKLAAPFLAILRDELGQKVATDDALLSLWYDNDFLKNSTKAKGSAFLEEVLEIGEIKQNIIAFLVAVSATLKGRRIFFTENGRVGAGMEHIAPGDVLAVVKGFNMPMVLRKEGSHFRFVSACYIPGVMDGEALVGRENEVVDIEIH